MNRGVLVRALQTIEAGVRPFSARERLERRAAGWDRPVLSVVVLALGVVGCVWSPDIREKGENKFAPTIERTLVSPSPDRAVVLTSDPVEFSVEGAVADEDDNIETLQYVWFLDWPQNCEPGQCYGPFYFPGRGANKKLTMNPCGLFKKYLETDEYHLLELIVTDGEVKIDVEEGRTVTGGHAYVAWWLENRLSCP